MKKNLKIVYKDGSGELVEKKSRFIATVKAVHNEQEAVEFIEGMKKKYWDARHNCSAFVLGDGTVTRCSDDGEPSGTAGRPMLEVLLSENVTDVCVVVTRYFGGVLLGTGGLVRAYQGAVKEGLAGCELAERKEGVHYTLTTDYPGFGKIQYMMETEGIPCLHTTYADGVTLEVICPVNLQDRFLKRVTEVTNGQAGIEFIKECFYLETGGKVEITEPPAGE